MSLKSLFSSDLHHVSEEGSVAWQRLPRAKHSLVLSGDITVTSGITDAPPLHLFNLPAFSRFRDML